MSKHRVPAFYKKHQLPASPTWRDWVSYPYHVVRAYVTRMLRVFGWRFLLFLCASQLFLKGAAYYLSLSVMLPLLKNVFGVDAFRFQMYMMITMIPWSIKPILGMCFIPLFCSFSLS